MTSRSYLMLKAIMERGSETAPEIPIVYSSLENGFICVLGIPRDEVETALDAVLKALLTSVAGHVSIKREEG